VTVLLDRLVAAYEAARDPVAAGPMRKYMRDQFDFLGIPNPVRTTLDREITAGIAPPTEAELAHVAKACWGLPHREYQYFACGYLRKHIGRAGPGFIDVAERLITTTSWWDTVDALATRTVGPLVRSHPELVTTMDDWIESENFWLARTALLHQLTYKADSDVERLFRYCHSRAGDREFFIRKAIGWALREYSKTDEAAVRAFVAEMGDNLSGLSRTEALKWLERRAARAR
jgi:3-methyladenine DNA glycosylase AlkD